MFVRFTRVITVGVALAAGGSLAFVACAPALAGMAGSASAGESSFGSIGIALERPIEFPGERPACPEEMAFVERTYCIDRWEASLVEVTESGESPYSPFQPMRVGAHLRAISRSGVTPQAYVSRDDAAMACASAGKRLCRGDEWVLACRGARAARFPYGNSRRSGVCNDQGNVSPLKSLFAHLGGKMFSFEPMNDPRLNTLPGTLAKTGSHGDCRSEYGVYDMVGNLHEWVDEPQSSFRGGYYLDTHENGDGCDYKTVAHAPDYHDYSTGFRCCADIQR